VRPHLQKNKNKRTRGVAKVVENLLSKYRVLNSIQSHRKEGREERREGGRKEGKCCKKKKTL
jgi:hypothetical protein